MCTHTYTYTKHTRNVKIKVMISGSEKVGRKRTNHERHFLASSLQGIRINYAILSVCVCVLKYDYILIFRKCKTSLGWGDERDSLIG